ncbi:MAG: hypothetical protein GC200_11305 [Tepidisphaera sp.]|nr:hypothetical protein [Tepidisphaera sp.]
MRSSLSVSIAAIIAASGSVLVQPALGQLSLRPASGVDEAALPRPICGCGKCNAMRTLAEEGLSPNGGGGGYQSREAPGDTDLLTVNLDLNVDFGAGSLSGSNTMQVRSLVNGLTQFTFMLRSNFLVQRGLSGQAADTNKVTLNGGTIASVTTPGANSYGRTVTLDRPYNMGETFTVKIDYSGVPVSRGFGSINIGTQNGAPIAASLSEPYYAATWWPVKDGDFALPGDNGDKATGTISITVPDTLKGVSNGLPTGTSTPAPGKTKYTWSTNYQTAPYLFMFSATNYNQWQQTYTYPLAGGGTGTMPVHFSIYPADDTPANRAAWELCLTMLSTYRPIYGEYPFVNEKYGLYEFQFGGGQEHQTYTGQGGFWESVTAHELGHQWWGDNITCKYWNDIWLNEGFATYTEALWAERKPGSSGLPALFAAMAARRPSAVNDSVYCYDVTNVNRIFDGNFSYDKGGWALHQLRHVVGDSTFFQILHDYRQLYQGGGATTQDFANVCSATSGQDLNWFFQQCVFGIGAPAYNYAFVPATIGGQPYLKAYIEQTQDATWPGAGAPAGYFRFPIDVVVTEGSSSQTISVQNNARSQYFLMPLAASASTASLDPNNWILATGKTAVAYPAGPAKVALASPAPGAALTAAPASLSLVFSENVNAPGSAFTLSGPGGSVPFTLAYNAGSQSATLTPTAPLPAGSYTLAWTGSQITSVTGGAALDGETTGALPSGDGQAGGNGSISFTIAPACEPDVNQDGVADQGDVDYLVNAIAGGGNPTGIDPDFNHDGVADQGDVDALINVIAGGQCP